MFSLNGGVWLKNKNILLKYLEINSRRKVKHHAQLIILYNMSRLMTKPKKMACAPSEDSDQPGHPPSLIRVFAVRMKKSWAGRMPRLIRVFAGRTCHFVGFVMRWLIFVRFVIRSTTYSQHCSTNIVHQIQYSIKAEMSCYENLALCLILYIYWC